MKFDCLVKTIKGQAEFTAMNVDAPNQGTAKLKAMELAKRCGLTPTGRVKATKVKD